MAEPHHAVCFGSCVVFCTKTNDIVYVGDVLGSADFCKDDRIVFLHPADFEDLKAFTNRRRKERVKH